MRRHGRPVQSVLLGKLLHRLAALVRCDELGDLFIGEATLYLPLPYAPRSHPPTQEGGQGPRQPPNP
jgi:hypothetical protein